MDLYEQAVQIYLAMDRGIFLNPQYLIGVPGQWEANPDFLALEFPQKRAWMVEVTKAPRTGLFDKIAHFQQQYVPRIKGQLIDRGVATEEEFCRTWKIGLWIFAPEGTIASLRQRIEAAGVQPWQTTALEAAWRPDAWNERFR